MHVDTSPDGWKTIKAKYNGKCFRCQGRIFPGNYIRFNVSSRAVHCSECQAVADVPPLDDLSTPESMEHLRASSERLRNRPLRYPAYKKYAKKSYSKVQKIREHGKGP